MAVLNGRGTLTGVNANGVNWTYTGDIKDGKRHGRGKLIFADDRCYEGDWVNDKKHGKGKFTWPTGEMYEGDWANDDINGKGAYRYKSGDFYEGDYVDGGSFYGNKSRNSK